MRQAVLDNLLKGAATQCLQVSPLPHRVDFRSFVVLQNLNLSLGLGEYDGIPLDF